eukprot:4603963-Amphidinium_carterae.1
MLSLDQHGSLRMMCLGWACFAENIDGSVCYIVVGLTLLSLPGELPVDLSASRLISQSCFLACVKDVLASFVVLRILAHNYICSASGHSHVFGTVRSRLAEEARGMLAALARSGNQNPNLAVGSCSVKDSTCITPTSAKFNKHDQ